MMLHESQNTIKYNKVVKKSKHHTQYDVAQKSKHHYIV